MLLPLDAASLGLAGLGVANLGVANLGVANLGVASLVVAGLGSINLVTPPSRRPKDYAPSPLRPFTVSAPSPSHRSAADPKTPQTPQPPLKAANNSKRPQSNSKKPPHRIGRHQIDIDKRGWPIRKS
ncbi:hypothetical protein N9N21_04555 [Alphaproteobacteria bacterium]|nr:hypothetical protein [Alphaproteobacteria bacterium]